MSGASVSGLIPRAACHLPSMDLDMAPADQRNTGGELTSHRSQLIHEWNVVGASR